MTPYLLDTGTTLVRRAARGENVLEAHREHAYQKLANERGLGHVPVAALYAGLAAAAAVATQIVVREA